MESDDTIDHLFTRGRKKHGDSVEQLGVKETNTNTTQDLDFIVSAIEATRLKKKKKKKAK